MASSSSCSDEMTEAMELSDDDTKDHADHLKTWIDVEFVAAEPTELSHLAGDNMNSAPGSDNPQKGIIAQPVNAVYIYSEDIDVCPSNSECEGSDLDSEYDDEYNKNPMETTDFTGSGREIPDNDELEEPVRNLITSVERAMDEAADHLLGVSNSFNWVEDFASFRGEPERFSGPTPGPLKDYNTPYDAFVDIWDKDIMECITRETNKYAAQTIATQQLKERLGPSSRLHQWKDTNTDELMVFFAVCMYMGIDQRSSQDEYWVADDVLSMPRFRDIMTFNRYILLNKFLHFTDNSDASQDYLQYEGLELSAKLAKLKPVISHLNQKFSSLYNLQKEIAIKESLTLFKGRFSWIQAIRSKSAHIGIKSYELCESHTGYLYKFQIYTVKNSTDSDQVPLSVDLGGKTTKIVLHMLKTLENRGHSVTLDNYYNSPSLARYLKSLGFDCLGTLRKNRRNVPEDIAKLSNNVEKGTIVARHSGDVSVIAWKDSKLMTMISTCHNADTFVESKAGRRLVKPVSVKDYSNIKGGVALKDKKLSMYLLEHKRCLKWYVKMFKRLLNVSIQNAYIMYVASLKRHGKSAMTHRQFCKELADSLQQRHHSASEEIIEPEGKLMRLRRNVVHLPRTVPRANRKICVVHQRHDKRKMVNTKCETCEVHLCFEGSCWMQWHSIAELQGRDVRRRKRSRKE